MRSGPSRALILIVALALVVRVAVIVATPDFKPLFDAADYDRHAVSIAAGEGYADSQFALGPTAFRPPLYPYALAAVQEIGGGWTAERLFGALLGAVTVLLIFVIAERLWDRRVAVVAGVVAAIFPPLVDLNASLLSEVLFLPLTLAALLAVLEYRDSSRMRWALCAGAVCGLAILTRTVGAPIVLALALGVWTARPRFTRSGLAAPLVLLLAAVVIVSPWVIRNAVTFDRWVGLGTGGGFALAGTYSDESQERAAHPGEPFSPNELRTYRDLFEERSLDEVQFTSKLQDDAMEFIGDNPGYVPGTIGWNVLRVFELERDSAFESQFAATQMQALGVERLASPVAFLGALYVVLALALLGAAAQLRLPASRRVPLFAWAIPVLLLLPALAIYGIPRYRAPIDPYLVMLAAAGVVAAFDRWTTRRETMIGADGPR